MRYYISSFTKIGMDVVIFKIDNEDVLKSSSTALSRSSSICESVEQIELCEFTFGCFITALIFFYHLYHLFTVSFLIKAKSNNAYRLKSLFMVMVKNTIKPKLLRLIDCLY